ncbi:hypothetical protein AFLA_008569 [Aspergillus flavus NRRL3357]|nr:hypothetical protein AFLA_008569 [Aspergillus flavus NRRL3357]
MQAGEGVLDGRLQMLGWLPDWASSLVEVTRDPLSSQPALPSKHLERRRRPERPFVTGGTRVHMHGRREVSRS